MTLKIENEMRKQIAKFLPTAMRKALASYKRFIKNKGYAGIENFRRDHDACKLALSHIKLLIELAQWADLMPAEDQNDVLAKLIEEGRRQVDEYESKISTADER